MHLFMRKRLLRVTLAVIAALVPIGSTLAQVPTDQQVKAPLLKMSKAEKARAQKEFQAQHPLLARQKALAPRHSAFPNASLPIRGFSAMKKAVGPLFANPSTTIWANMSYMEGWTNDNYGPFGYYSFSPTNPVEFTSLYETSSQRVAGNGVQYTDGHIYGMYLDTRYSSYGIIYQYLYDTDTDAGTTTSTSYDYEYYLPYAALETAQADDGTVYGEFYNSDGSAYEWGTVDYSTMTRTTIATATNAYVALGITKEGQLYGIATDGNLYKIDKATGEETVVGATGLTIADASGSYYGQTGEIDQKDNTFYWTALDVNGNGGLYEVNLETGAATKIADENNQMYGMVIPAPAAADGAPAKVTDAVLSFQGAEHIGKLTFTAPTKTYSGADLGGDLTYKVYEGDSVITSGTTAPGAQVSKSIYVEGDGSHTFSIRVSNEAGESPAAKVTVWIGFDIPRSVTDITAVADGQNVTVSWTAPTLGIHGGYIGTPTYNIYYWDGENFTQINTEPITETSYTDVISGTSLQYLTYAVTAEVNGEESAYSTSNGVVVGNAIEPDWTEEFNSEGDFGLFTVIDANNDGRTWTWYSTYQAARSYYNSSESNDDWLITPPIHLTPGRLYTFSFKVRNAYSSFTNSLEVKYGNAATAEAMTNTLLETTVPGANYEVYSFDINPTEDGNYYFGFHDNSVADQFYLLVDSIVVAKGALGTAPRAVTDLTVTPADKGALSATLTFKAPTQNIDGADIAQVDSFQVTRDGELIATLPSATAGSDVTYTDAAVPTNDTHKYVVTPYIGGEFGARATASAFIGQDVPNYPVTSLTDNTTNILASWDAFTEEGANGGYIDPSHVSVSFFTLEQGFFGYEVGDSITTSAQGATSVELPQNPEETTAEDGTTQTLYQLAARANGDGGQSSYALTGSTIIGPSIAAPYHESFAGASIDNGFAWIEGNEQYMNNDYAAGWYIDTSSQDDDGGSAWWAPYTEEGYWYNTDYTITAGDEVSINTPKISLNGTANPKLYFYVNTISNDQAHLKVLIATPDGVEHEAANYDLSTSGAGWAQKEIDLSTYAAERYIIVKFRGIADGDNVSIGLDNIDIFDQLEYNLTAKGITAPSRLTAGKTGKVDVVVENYGANPASDYSVVLYANDKAVDTVAVAEALAVLATDTVTLDLPVAINQTEALNVRATIVYANDLDEDDNTTETKVVTVTPSQYGTVSDLAAEDTKAGVALTWSKPTAAAPVQVTEDFESYDAFSTELGNWTLVDGDGGLAGGFFQSYTYPGQGTAFAFQAFNPNGITDAFDVIENNPGLAPHSGNQFAGAPYTVNAEGTAYVAPDNWIISPELSGRAQTVKFYVFNIAAADDNGGTQVYNEKFDVLYSTESTDTADFEVIESDQADGNTVLSEGANWKEISVQLPEGAKYFAIHHNTDAGSNFLFGIDDITFEQGAPGANDSIIGFNVYRDGELIGSAQGNALAFTDAAMTEGAHVYNITVLYQSASGDINESGFSNDASITVTGIDGVVANAEGKYDVYTIDGKVVMKDAKSLNGLKSGLYIINDQKYIIK